MKIKWKEHRGEFVLGTAVSELDGKNDIGGR